MKITITFDENSDAGQSIKRALRSLSLEQLKDGIKFVGAEDKEFPVTASEPAIAYKRTMNEPNYTEELESIPFERIPGFAYTHEERLTQLREAEARIATGDEGMLWEDFKKEMDTWW